MNNMIERVRDAILASMDLTDSLDEIAAETYARAAIAAMREPTEEMIEAAKATQPERISGALGVPRHVGLAETYSLMIDAALKE